MELSMIILISVVFIIAFAWVFIKGANDKEFCEACGDELFGGEVGNSGKCNMCNAYEKGEVL